MRTSCILFLIHFLCVSVYGQVSGGGVPFSFSGKQVKKPVPSIVLPVTIPDSLKIATDSYQPRLKKLTYGRVIKTAIRPYETGIWNEMPEFRGRIWRVAIESPGAYSVGLVFKPFHLPPGAKLFLYDKQQEMVLGAYTRSNNNKANTLAIQPVKGDKVVVELFIPYDSAPYSLSIDKVIHDYVNVFNHLRADDCTADLKCYAERVGKEKDAVFSYLFPIDATQAELCTGVLVNNSARNNIPYFLTANHCINDTATARQMVAFFNYERYYCNGPAPPREYKTLSGASLVSSIKTIDMSLGEFHRVPPFRYKPYYAGWDVSGQVPDRSYCIQQPQGNPKTISIDNNSPQTSRYGKEYLLGSHWLIKNWETGTTDGGSSGAPLFDGNGHVVGTLVGGGTKCADEINDFFAKFSRTWDEYSDKKIQMEHWLDPLHTNKSIMTGYDPYKIYSDSCDTLKTYTNSRDLKVMGVDSGGYWSGHNADSITRYAEKFEGLSSIEIPGVYVNVAKAFGIFNSSIVIMKLWDDNGGVPGHIITQKIKKINEFKADADNYVEFDSIIHLEGDFYVGYELFYRSFFRDTFALYQTNKKETSFQVFAGDQWMPVNEYSGEKINGSLAISIVACDSVPLKIQKPDKPVEPEIGVYPNPAYDAVTIDFGSSNLSNIRVSLYNLSGQVLMNRYYAEYRNGISLPVSHLQPGLYIVRIHTETTSATKKIHILNR